MSKKRIICLLICICVVVSYSLTGCGLVGKFIRSDKKDQTVEQASPEEEQKSADKTDKGDKDKTQKKKEPFTLINHNLICETEDGKTLADGVYPEIRLSEDTEKEYPKLVNYIESLNETWSENVRNGVALYGSYAQDEVETSGQYRCEVTAEIVRFDDRMLSIALSSYDHSGGPHPNHARDYENIDPVTGARIPFESVLSDPNGVPDIIKKAVYDNYPDLVEEISSYIVDEAGESDDVFTQKLKDDQYSWTITDKGLEIVFSPYEIASYAVGYIEITLDFDDYPDLVQSAYIPDGKIDAGKLVRVRDFEPEPVEPGDPFDSLEEEDIPTVGETYVENPSWSCWNDGSYANPDAKHISLKKLSENKSDWLSTDAWADENGFTVARLPYSDEDYYYEPAQPVEYNYMYNELLIYDSNRQNLLYDLKLYNLINGPDEKEQRMSKLTQYLRWAQLKDGILYVSIGHNTYAESEPDSSYMAAIDPETGKVIWRSDPLVSNALNFKIVGDTIICGYGFTAEPDFIYLLDLSTGKTVDKIKVNTGPDQFEVVGDTLYVATDNTAYTFKISQPY